MALTSEFLFVNIHLTLLSCLPGIKRSSKCFTNINPFNPYSKPTMLVVLLFSFFVLCEAVHWFLAVAEMNDHKLGLKKKKSYSHILEARIRNQGVGPAAPSRGSREDSIPCLFQLVTSLTWDHIIPFQPSTLCLHLCIVSNLSCFSFMRTPVLGLKVH